MLKKAIRRSFFWLAALGLLVFAVKQFPDQGQEAASAYRQGDYETAAAFWKKLARKGDKSAQYNLGALYANGQGVEKDAARAYTWFLKAAESGVPAAQYAVGKSYETGQGVAPSGPVGLMWIRESANQNYQPAQADMGLKYLTGQGVQKDPKKARFWLTQAAGGDRPAQVLSFGAAPPPCNGP